jgi:hypothetical protein
MIWLGICAERVGVNEDEYRSKEFGSACLATFVAMTTAASPALAQGSAGNNLHGILKATQAAGYQSE